MSEIKLSDLGRIRSEQEFQSVVVFASAEVKKADHPITTYSTGVYIGDWDRLQVCMDITASATDAGDVLDVSVQMSMDNLAWYDVGGFTQQAGNGAACMEMMHFVPGGPATNVDAILIGSTLCGSTVTRENLVGRYIRCGIGVTDANADAAHTLSIHAQIFRNDIVRNEGEMKEIVLYPLAAYTNETVPAASSIYEIGDSWELMQVVLRTTNHDTDSGDKLDVMIDLSVDGVMWINVGMFTQCDGDDGPWVELMTFRPGLPNNIDAILVVTADAGETVIRPGIAGAYLRARSVITESGTDDETFTYAVKAYVK